MLFEIDGQLSWPAFPQKLTETRILHRRVIWGHNSSEWNGIWTE